MYKQWLYNGAGDWGCGVRWEGGGGGGRGRGRGHGHGVVSHRTGGSLVVGVAVGQGQLALRAADGVVRRLRRRFGPVL
jgi:hypothetical protein